MTSFPSAQVLLNSADSSGLIDSPLGIWRHNQGGWAALRSRRATGASPCRQTLQGALERFEEAGVSDPDLLEACIVEVSYTQDDEFAETAAVVQARDFTNWNAGLTKRADAGS